MPRKVLAIDRDQVEYRVQGVLTLVPLKLSITEFACWVVEAIDP